jgi:hypothetical protein
MGLQILSQHRLCASVLELEEIDVRTAMLLVVGERLEILRNP